MQITLACASKLWRAIDTPRALTCEIMARYGEWESLANLRCSPQHYLDARALQLDVLATDFLRKHEGLPTGIDTAARAVAKFLEAESQCAITNVRFSQLTDGLLEGPSDAALLSFLSEVKECVRQILGRVPDEVYPRFGPGATFDDKCPLTTVPDKMMSTPTLTPGAQPFLKLWETTAWGREYLRRWEKGGKVRFESSDRFTTVPKDATTDRAIAIQPSINVFYQLGVGTCIRNRLRRWGIDLNHGQETHVRVAREASAHGGMATIDLSSASDTISTGVVKSIVPSMWYSLLSSLRTTHTTLRGKRYRLEKFSAMGNGYTFELETLIFSSIVKVTLDRLGFLSIPGVSFHVYGDDIIVPSESADTVLAVLRWFGFTPNPKKTFTKGPFRESCGGDFFEGQPVRGLTLEKEPNEPHQRIALANGLRRIIKRFHRRDRARRRLLSVWCSILDTLPSDIRRLRGPVSLGDLVIHDDRGWDTRVDPDCKDLSEIRVWQPVPARLPWYHWPAWTGYAGALYGIGSDGVTPRGDVAGYRRAWVALIERPA